MITKMKRVRDKAQLVHVEWKSYRSCEYDTAAVDGFSCVVSYTSEQQLLVGLNEREALQYILDYIYKHKQWPVDEISVWYYTRTGQKIYMFDLDDCENVLFKEWEGDK